MAEQTREFNEALNRSSGSFELVLSPLLLALIGLWLDRTLGTAPLLTILLGFAGVLGAVTKIYYGYRHRMAELEQGQPWMREEKRPA